MPTRNKEFALYCCDLLSGVGPCQAKGMFGGFGITTGGLTIALMTDLGHGDKLWLKASAETAAQFKAAGGEQFMYAMKGEMKGMNYFTAPEEAMESPALMLPWARLALQAAVAAQALKAAKVPKAPKATKAAKPAAAKPVVVAKKSAARATSAPLKTGRTAAKKPASTSSKTLKTAKLPK